MTTKQHSFKEWFIATRPWSFPASSMPIIATVAYLVWISFGDSFELNWVNAVLTLLAMILFQAAGNLLSDYMDFKHGVDRKDSVCVPILVEGLFEPKQIRIFGAVLLALAALIGFYLAHATGWPVYVIGAIGVLTTWFYSVLKYHALGDICIFIDYAILPILGTTFVVMGRFCYDALILAVPVGLITVAILHANNTRDVESDRRANIVTLSMKVGRATSAIIYVVELMLPYLWLLLCVLVWRTLPTWVLLSLITFPLAYKNVCQMLSLLADGAEPKHTIADLDQKTAQLQMFFSLTLSAGMIMSIWMPNLFD